MSQAISGVLRLCPERPLPAYRYVPGRHPHPNKHAGGHNFLAAVDWGQSAWEPHRPWPANRRYLYAHDLFAHRFLWESHEVWEELWHAIPVERPERRLIQGLIQTAATTLKHHMGHDKARGRLAERAVVHLKAAAVLGEVVWGVDIPALVAQLDARVACPVVGLRIPLSAGPRPPARCAPPTTP